MSCMARVCRLANSMRLFTEKGEAAFHPALRRRRCLNNARRRNGSHPHGHDRWRPSPGDQLTGSVGAL